MALALTLPTSQRPDDEAEPHEKLSGLQACSSWRGAFRRRRNRFATAALRNIPRPYTSAFGQTRTLAIGRLRRPLQGRFLASLPGPLYQVFALEPLSVIARNFFWCPEWDDTSFLGRLHEDAIWSRDEYWLLERAMYQLVAASAHDSGLRWRVFRIFSNTVMSISAHFDRNDTFKVKNLTQNELYAFRERFRLVSEGFFSGQMSDLKECFEELNPLLSAGS